MQNYFTDKKQTKLTTPSVDTQPRRLSVCVFAGKTPTHLGGGSLYLHMDQGRVLVVSRERNTTVHTCHIPTLYLGCG